MSEFQFLRPLWLLALLLVPLLVWLQHHGGAGSSQWQRVIPRPLLQPLLPDGRNEPAARRRARLAAPLLLALMAVALAGPSFRTAPSPLQQPDDSLVVVLDLSLSMLAADVEPDRLTRAKRKIHDLLAAREGAFTGLVVYAADGYVVAPLTDDRRTVEGMLGALEPLIMPAAGNRADLGVARAVELLEQGAPGRGRILLITDSLNPRYGERIQQQLEDTPWQLYGLMTGTETGAPVPMPEQGFIRDGERVVISRASLTDLASAARDTGGAALAMTTTDRDIIRLGLRAEDHDSWQAATRESTTERRQDDGYWLLWLAIPLALVGWRKGALALVAVSLGWFPAAPVQAADWQQRWQDMWQTPEQRAPELIAADPAGAAARLKDPLWQGTALYRDGQYEGAADAFARDDSALAHFNRGNALARAGKPEAALEAWQAALDRDPDHKGARQNQQLMKQYLEQQRQNQQSGGDTSGDGTGEQDSGPGQAPQDSQPGTNPGDLSADGEQPNGGQPDGENGESGQNGESAEGRERGEGSNRPGAEGQGDQPGSSAADGAPQPGTGASADTEAAQGAGNGDGQTAGLAGDNDDEPRADALSQSQEQWLRRVPDDPGGLLRRKFLQQSRGRNLQPDENDTPW